MKEEFIDAVFTGEPLPTRDDPGTAPNLHERLLCGGYPEVLSRSSESRRRAWFGSYVTTILQRDVRDIASIERLTELPRLLSLLAARSASLVNYAELSRSASMPQSTLKRYVSLLEATFLVRPLLAWSSNLDKRLVRSPKLLPCDTGLISGLQGLSAERLASDPILVGPLLENIVAMELQKQSA